MDTVSISPQILHSRFGSSGSPLVLAHALPVYEEIYAWCRAQ